MAVVVGATGLVLGACSSGEGEMTVDRPQPGKPALDIQNFAFEPPTLTVAAGSRIQVTNQDSAPHTVTADDKSFDSGNIAGMGKAEITVSRTGEIPYHCTIHDYMRGVIRVAS